MQQPASPHMVEVCTGIWAWSSLLHGMPSMWPYPIFLNLTQEKRPLRVTGVAQRTLDNEWQCNTTIYNDQQAVHAALKNQLFHAIPKAYWAGVTDPLTGMAGISLIEMYAHLYTNYGALMEDDLEDNRAPAH
jgi:hypothetical protein